MKKAQSYRLRFGGDDAARTRYLYVANVPLYQLSYIPIGYNQNYSHYIEKLQVFFSTLQTFSQVFSPTVQGRRPLQKCGKNPSS